MQKRNLSTPIKDKVNALGLLYTERKQDFYIRGGQYMIPSRIEKAKNIIKQFHPRKVFIGGSFLFSKEYNDIDVYVMRERGYKEEFIGEKHIIHLPERRLSKAIFQSTALISVSNFNNLSEYKYKRPFLHELMSTYHEAVIQLKQKEKKKDFVRELIFIYSILVKGKLPNAVELRDKERKIELKELDKLFKETCSYLFSDKYLYVEIHDYIKTLDSTIKNIKQNKHLIHYKNVYEELIYGNSSWKHSKDS